MLSSLHPLFPYNLLVFEQFCLLGLGKMASFRSLTCRRYEGERSHGTVAGPATGGPGSRKDVAATGDTGFVGETGHHHVTTVVRHVAAQAAVLHEASNWGVLHGHGPQVACTHISL